MSILRDIKSPSNSFLKLRQNSNKSLDFEKNFSHLHSAVGVLKGCLFPAFRSFLHFKTFSRIILDVISSSRVGLIRFLVLSSIKFTSKPAKPKHVSCYLSNKFILFIYSIRTRNSDLNQNQFNLNLID